MNIVNKLLTKQRSNIKTSKKTGILSVVKKTTFIDSKKENDSKTTKKDDFNFKLRKKFWRIKIKIKAKKRYKKVLLPNG